MSSPDGTEVRAERKRLEELERRLRDAESPERQDQIRILLTLENLTETLENMDQRQRDDGKELARRGAVIDEYREWRVEVERDLMNLRDAWTRLDERFAGRQELDETYQRREDTAGLPPLAQKLLAGAALLLALSSVFGS